MSRGWLRVQKLTLSSPKMSGRTPKCGAADFFLDELAQQRMGRAVLEGAPGQGKSTIAQYLCQVYRIRLLSKRGDLNLLPERHRTGSVRIPFKIDLRDFAMWLAKKDPFSAATSQESPKNWEKSL